jgi:hypothetical protein
MRLHTEATDRRSVRLPSTGAALASRPTQRQRPAARLQPAMQQGPQCDDCSHRSRRQPGPSRRSALSAQGTPPFGLVLPAMNVGKRHRRAPQMARHLSALMSVIALALACSPALAQAECTTSSCVQYTESIPKPEGENTPTHHQQETHAKASNTGNGGSETSHSQGSKGTKEAEGSEEGESSEEKKAAVAGGNSGGNGQGKPGGSANDGGKQTMHPGAQNGSGVQTSKSSDGGGSSPLVPILIAIALLAAISVGVVMVRQRRQRRGPTGSAPSPKAS